MAGIVAVAPGGPPRDREVDLLGGRQWTHHLVVGGPITWSPTLLEAWSSLDVAGIDADVLAFLKAANTIEGAPLSLYSAPVRAWLEQRGASNRYSIRPVG